MIKGRAEYIRKVADPTFSKYIRLKESINGRCTCVTCGAVHSYTHMDCGHFVPRAHMATRYEEANCGPQCHLCNRMQDGMALAFSLHLVHKYSENKVNWLKAQTKVIKKFQLDELKLMVSKWKIGIKEFEGTEVW